MRIIVNKAKKTKKHGITIFELLENENYKTWSIVWVNGKHIFIKNYKEFVLHDNDVVIINDFLVGG
ncbi:MAG: hypothetical protein RBR71_11775 [Gudongella sp.]|nr:hypothetical protein [Gudongella sp.]